MSLDLLNLKQEEFCVVTVLYCAIDRLFSGYLRRMKCMVRRAQLGKGKIYRITGKWRKEGRLDFVRAKLPCPRFIVRYLTK